PPPPPRGAKGKPIYPAPSVPARFPQNCTAAPPTPADRSSWHRRGAPPRCSRWSADDARDRTGSRTPFRRTRPLVQPVFPPPESSPAHAPPAARPPVAPPLHVVWGSLPSHRGREGQFPPAPICI